MFHEDFFSDPRNIVIAIAAAAILALSIALGVTVEGCLSDEKRIAGGKKYPALIVPS